MATEKIVYRCSCGRDEAQETFVTDSSVYDPETGWEGTYVGRSLHDGSAMVRWDHRPSGALAAVPFDTIRNLYL